jgi:hypothetical protein
MNREKVQRTTKIDETRTKKGQQENFEFIGDFGFMAQR